MSDARTRDVLCEADRLELDGLVAPILRSATDEALKRRWKVVKADDPNWSTSQPVGYADGVAVLRGHAKVQELEHVVEDGVRPKTISCPHCGRLVVVHKGGAIPDRCYGGQRAQCLQKTCSEPGCTQVPHPRAFAPSVAVRRNGRPWACRIHWDVRVRHPKPARGVRENRKNLTPEQRSEVCRQAALARSSESRRAEWLSRSPEARAEMSRKCRQAALARVAAKTTKRPKP